ncbi:MAG: hypothetical protein OHK93_008759 [Ramalina farinacea]|uniref:C3H1-type domain-containing protein n=1 Tax=Ramalina farinacea TaxID=258253 RepID=A0AA43TWX3_9LECA|nr:hypothetical protein [Ramalina farinacea]
MATEEVNTLRQKFELLKGAEQHKNALIEELLARLDELSDDYRQEKLDHARESHFNREVQKSEMSLKDEIRKIKSVMNRDPFILVLIDGDGTIFNDKLLAKGEAGGKDAAAYLWSSVSQFVHERIPDLATDYKIVTRVYANLKGLGDVCQRAGLVETPAVINDFARGFTGSKQLFDFVDVGVGKDRADDKISEIFKLHLYDTHCRHILFGCSHDNGYARLLEDVGVENILNSITLLEGVPFERELDQLRSRYQTIRFDGLFRAERINVYNNNYQPQQQHPYYSSPPNNGTSTQQPNGLPPPPPGYHSPYQTSISLRTPSDSTNSSTAPGSHPPGLNPAATSWAATAKSQPAIVSPPPTPQPVTDHHQKPPQVPRNRFGQRVDPVVTYDPNEVKRIKKLKMCNVNFLRNDCPYDPCTHDHHYKPTKNELQTLRYVSRMTPCKFRGDCDDLKCIYGHRCPNDTEGSSTCRWGENCRFDVEAHGIDRRVVNVVKVGGK